MQDDKFLESLGAKIKKIRMSKNVSQIKLATDCDFDKASMSRMESGQTNPTILTLRKVSNALDVHISEFFRD